MAAGMGIPIIHITPDRSIRAGMIAHSSGEGLEQIRQHALATMFALSEAKGILSPSARCGAPLSGLLFSIL
jgi:hypothetical protein